MSTLCQALNHFSGFLHHFVLAKLATNSIRIDLKKNSALERDLRNSQGILSYSCERDN